MSYKLFLDDKLSPKEALKFADAPVDYMAAFEAERTPEDYEEIPIDAYIEPIVIDDTILAQGMDYNDEWVHVTSYEDFTSTVDRLGVPDMISYDFILHPSHEAALLEEDEDIRRELIQNFSVGSGYQCAEYILELLGEGEEHPIYAVHTGDLLAKEYIRMLIEEHKYDREIED